MKKVLTPQQAYKIITKLAKAQGITISAYVESCGVRRDSVHKWQNKKTGTINLNMAQKLGIV